MKMRIRLATRSALAFTLMLSVASAQNAPPQIPFDLLDGELRGGGTNLTFCVDDRVPGTDVDVAIAEAIASAQFLEPVFYRISEMPGRIDEFIGVPDELLFVLLEDECDAYIGALLGPRTVIPEWVTVTRPYYTASYVLASTNPEVTNFRALRDLDIQLGLPIASRMNTSVSVSEPETRRRVYDDEPQLYQALMDGEVEAGMFFGPKLLAMTNRDPLGAGLTLAPVDPVPNGEAPVAMMLMNDQTFVRSLIDDAISALTSNGTIESILAEAGFDQLP